MDRTMSEGVSPKKFSSDKRIAANKFRRRRGRPLPKGHVGTVPTGYLTRAEFLDRTGLSLKQLKKLTGEGKIRSSLRSTRGWALYDLEAVNRVRRSITCVQKDEVSFTSEEAIDVFRRIRTGQSLDVICIETDLHPYVISSIAQEFAKLNGAMILPKGIVETINLLPIEGIELPIVKPEQIAEALRIGCEERRCDTCRNRPPSRSCSFCVQERVERKRSAQNAQTAAPSEEIEKAS
jgi:hypothetical protein